MAGAAESLTQANSRRAFRAYCRLAVRRRVDLRVEGLEHVPRTGPALLAARHVHHHHDGCILAATLPRPVHILVALDWARGRDRRLLEWACTQLRWPTLFRPDAPPSAVDPAEATRYLRRAVHDSVELLRAGGLLIVFPEGYPNVDPRPTPKPDLDAFLPFQPGFVRIAALTERDGRTRVPIIPTGFHYERGSRWRVALRFGAPCYLEQWTDQGRTATVVEEHVRALSRPGVSGWTDGIRRGEDGGISPRPRVAQGPAFNTPGEQTKRPEGG